jgi:creatinine amidohydrolase
LQGVCGGIRAATVAAAPAAGQNVAAMPRSWAELTTAEFAALDRERAVAVLPLGAIEQHGPHLPLAVDAALAAGLLETALARLPAEPPVLALPALAVGHSPEHQGFAGTLSLSGETAIRMWTELGEGVARAGVRRLVLFNAHGGNPPAMDIVARELRQRARMLVVPASYWELGSAEGLLPAGELKAGIHAGALETAMMLHLRPDLVRRERIAAFDGAARRIDEAGRARFAWAAQDLNPAGAVGDARLATPEIGRALVERYAAGLARLLGEVAAFPLARLAEGPLDASGISLARS